MSLVKKRERVYHWFTRETVYGTDWQDGRSTSLVDDVDGPSIITERTIGLPIWHGSLSSSIKNLHHATRSHITVSH